MTTFFNRYILHQSQTVLQDKGTTSTLYLLLKKTPVFVLRNTLFFEWCERNFFHGKQQFDECKRKTHLGFEIQYIRHQKSEKRVPVARETETELMSTKFILKILGIRKHKEVPCSIPLKVTFLC